MPPQIPQNKMGAAFGANSDSGPFAGAGQGGLGQLQSFADGMDDDDLSADDQMGTPLQEPMVGGLNQAKDLGTLDPKQINQLVMRMRSTSARDMYNQALQAMINRKPEQGRLNLAALQMAGALLRPTKTGTFSEALGEAIPAGVQAQMYEDQRHEKQEDKTDTLRLKMAEHAANDERTRESELMRLMSSLYGKQGFRYATAEGNFLRMPDGTSIKLGSLTPQQQGAGAQMYEKTDDKLAAERDGKTYDEIVKQGQSSIAMNQTMEPIMELLKHSDFQGAAAPYLTNLESIAQSVGIDPKVFNLKGAGAAEATRGLTARLVLDKLGGSLGVGISNSDVTFMNSTVPTIANTDQANQILASLLKRVNDRQIEVMRFAYDFQKKNGNLKGIQQAIDQQFGDRSIFDKDFTKQDLAKLASDKDENTVGTFLKGRAMGGVNPAYQIELDYRSGKFGPKDSPEAKKKRDELLKPHGY